MKKRRGVDISFDDLPRNSCCLFINEQEDEKLSGGFYVELELDK